MTRGIQFFTAVVALVLLCSVAGAQTHGGISTIRISSARVAPPERGAAVIPASVRQARVLRNSPGLSSFASSTSFGSANGVPGLGFDYPHLAAISGGLRSGRTSNFGRGHHRGQGNFVPILVGGYPYYFGDNFYGDPYADATEYQQPQQQPQVIVIQQPAPVIQQAVDSGHDSVISVAPPPDQPVREVGEFILVRRDGRVLFASAYSVTGAQLHYITPEGIRRTVQLADLDAGATEQMNEARGTSVQIQN